SPLPFLERLPLYTPTGCGIGVDAFPYTREELARMVEEGNQLVNEALASGVVLYEREGAKIEGRNDDGASGGADRKAG
ncbi:MAG: hypothetical protein N2320_00300, partial [Candidatus Bipolaricaulota bacterium]|nr:hypothetical protein [Candidatus Bipolaricaulota bacterium]